MELLSMKVIENETTKCSVVKNDKIFVARVKYIKITANLETRIKS
jgi:hypothetical protein